MTVILRTENGPHPADAWAMITAEQIVAYDQLPADKLLKAQQLRLDLAQVLQAHIEAIQGAEQAKLKSDTAAIASPLRVEIADVVAGVFAKLAKSLWAEHFGRPEVQAVIEDIIQRNLNTVAYIERSLHADHNPDHPAVAVFRGH
jgi:hypothetical protein